ncbi:TetR family transcriptional regulator [Actinophytocola oryzae]|nr:TetR family transcriptional regulator [Actinophytocola oryzae]
MGRWEPNARGRLEQAALELFGERGFEQTTAAAIAERAGVTERTFFRHYADKREVLFAGALVMKDLLVGAVAEAPASASPLEATAGAIAAVGAMMQQRRELVRQRQVVVDANPELRERELAKMSTLGAALTGALRDRGVGELTARLTAEAGIAVFRVAFDSWVNDPDAAELPDVVRASFVELKAVTSGE